MIKNEQYIPMLSVTVIIFNDIVDSVIVLNEEHCRKNEILILEKHNRGEEETNWQGSEQ